MGYYTYFQLEVIIGESSLVDYKKEISEASGYEYGVFDDQVKWYDFKQEMEEYSRKHPDAVFLIKGVGEEQPDLWHAYFKNGKSQMCPAEISYDKFDESKLE